jgi:predicted lipoprotein with Yx(FWY)xxD motif
MRIKSAVVTVAAVALVASGVAMAAQQAVQKSAAKRTVVELHKTKSLGKVLATSKGLTLYLYTPDGKNKSNCTGSCASIWPPLLTKGKPKAAMGAKQSLLGTTRRSDNGKLQVTYKGHPLYLYTGDTKAGQTKGEGYGGIWYALKASGREAKKKSGSGGGYPPPPAY